MALNAFQTAVKDALQKKKQSAILNPLDYPTEPTPGQQTAQNLVTAQPTVGATTGATTSKPVTMASSGATAADMYRNRSQAIAAQEQAQKVQAMNNATPGQRQQMQQEEIRQEQLARMSPQAQSAYALTQKSTTTPTQQDIQKNAYQAAIDEIQPTDQYLWRNMGDNNMTTMTAEDKAKWNAAMAGYQNGDYSALNDNFLTAGNWSSYVDANGNVNGMLRAVDGIGGYVPVSNGKLLNYREGDDLSGTAFYGPNGEVYTVGAGGQLKQTGTWSDDYDTVMKNGYYKNDVNNYGDRMFIGKDGKAYTYATVPDEKLAEWGYVRRNNGIFYEPETVAKNNGGTWEQNNPLYKPGRGSDEYTDRLPSGTPSGNTPSGNSGYSESYRESSYTPTPSAGSYQPTGYEPAQAQAQAQTTPNAYQTYLDQWDYEPAPEWNGTDYEQKRDAALEAAGEKWQGSEYQPLRDAALKRAEEMQWNYDPNSDPVWQAYQKQYRREGDRASQEALAQAAMRTGGLANSYAVTAASQAGDYYASQLSDKLPQLYQDAYNRYLQEFQRQMGISDQYQGFDDREYSRWADQQGRNFDLADRYNQYGNTEYQRYLDQLGQYNTDRNFDYGRYRDAVGDARYADETAYDRNYQAQRDAISDQRYDQQWAQQLREYADAQGWKQAEWNQYLREYGDQLSERERQWAYQMARDAVSDAQYADQQAWNRSTYADEREYEREQDALDNQYRSDVWNQSLREYDDEQEREAWNYLRTNGIVTGKYAQILGVPDGTTYEQYYSRYLGGGSSGGAFEDSEIANPAYTPSTPPATTPPATTPPATTPPATTPPPEESPQENEYDGEFTMDSIANRHGNDWVYIEGHGRFSMQELLSLYQRGMVKATVGADGKITLTWNQEMQNAESIRDTMNLVKSFSNYGG